MKWYLQNKDNSAKTIHNNFSLNLLTLALKRKKSCRKQVKMAHENIAYSQKRDGLSKLPSKWKKIEKSKIARKFGDYHIQEISWFWKANKKEKELIEKLKKIRPLEDDLELENTIKWGFAVYDNSLSYSIFWFLGHHRVNNLLKNYGIEFDSGPEYSMDIVVHFKSLTEKNFHEALKKLLWAKKLYEEINQQQKITAEEITKRWIEVDRLANEKTKKII